jgi:methylated-DNA-[protein]-cysteine S-methyltransferase
MADFCATVSKKSRNKWMGRIGQNPLSIVVPCHRVVGANGTLTGYGGGLPRKKFLLDHEQRHRAFALTP